MAGMTAPRIKAAKAARAAHAAKHGIDRAQRQAKPVGARLEGGAVHEHLCAARNRKHAAAPRRNKRREARNKGWV